MIRFRQMSLWQRFLMAVVPGRRAKYERELREVITHLVKHPEEDCVIENELKTNDEPNYFGELLSVLSDEDLIRCRRRLERAEKPRTAEVLTDELEEREALERQTRPTWMNQN